MGEGSPKVGLDNLGFIFELKILGGRNKLRPSRDKKLAHCTFSKGETRLFDEETPLPKKASFLNKFFIFIIKRPLLDLFSTQKLGGGIEIELPRDLRVTHSSF